MERENPLQAGDVLGRYKVLRELGRGAMAIVYLAEENETRNKVAFKILLPKYENDESFVNRFINEARAAASLSHPNIIEALDIGFEKGFHFYCMEYVDGHSLLELIQQNSPIPLQQNLDIAIEVASALEYGWTKHKLTHGDIKPENIMLTSSGTAKLADFGLANMVGHEREEKDILLTPHYAAPELIHGIAIKGDCRTDIYAFGATLYHAFSGSQLFPGTDSQEVLDRQMHENPEPLNIRCPSVPPILSNLIGQMLCKSPEERPQNWTAVLKELQNIRLMLFGSHLQNTTSQQTTSQQTNTPQRQLSPSIEGEKAAKNLTRFIVISSIALGVLGLSIIAIGIHRYEKRQKAMLKSQQEINPATDNSPVETVKAVETVETIPPPPEEKNSTPVEEPQHSHTKTPQEQAKAPKQPRPTKTPSPQKAQVPAQAPQVKPPIVQMPTFPPVPGNFDFSLSKEYAEMAAKYANEKDSSFAKTVQAITILERKCKLENLVSIIQETKKILDDYTLRLNDEDKKVIESLRQKAQKLLPSSQKDALEQQAKDYLDKNDAINALTYALVAKARYDSKSQNTIDASLSRLSITQELALQSQSPIGLNIPFTTPLMPWEYYLIYSNDRFETLCKDSYAFSIMSPIAELYLGDWTCISSMKRIHSEQRRPNKKTQWEQLPASIKAAQGFAENLVSEYATDSGINWEWLKYASIKQQDAYNADTLSMTAYSALISHQSPKGKKPLEILSWQSGMNLSGTETSKRILCYMLYTIFTEYKDKQQLATLRRELKEKPQSYGFDKIPAFAEKNFSPDTLPPYDSIIAWAQLRAWMANAAGSNGLDGQMDSAIMNIFQEEAKLWPLHAGETIYAWLLNRTAFLLGKKDLAGALNLTDFTLNLKATCLIPYYAQLQALQTGLLFLAGKNGACYSVLDNMQSSSVASSSTLQLMNSIDDPDKTKRIFKTMSIGKNLWLWYAWLKACQNINRKRAQLDFTNYTEKCVPHPHEARLLDALTK